MYFVKIRRYLIHLVKNTLKNNIHNGFSTLKNEDIFKILEIRFGKNIHRHKNLSWVKIQNKLRDDSSKLLSLAEMEKTGGEPDVVGRDEKTGEYLFIDCSPETPWGRRSVCYDREGQLTREKKGIYPKGNALDMAAALGIELLTEEQYRELQKLGDFDSKSSSWLKTPIAIRKLGGAIFADRRYGNVFIYHNSAQTFYATRGFRGLLKV